MAQGEVRCTCKVCGTEFRKTKKCRNTKEAASWEEWAKDIFDLCPECYKKKQDEIKAKQPLVLKMRLEPYNLKAPVVFAFDGGTKQFKDRIKSLKYIWREDNSGVFGLLNMKPNFCWQRNTDLENMEDEIIIVKQEFPEIELHNEIKDVDIILHKRLKQKEAEKKEAIEKEVAKLQKPARPDCYPSGKWNGKIYGSEKYGYNIYIDGEKQDVSAEDRENILFYQKCQEEYHNKVKEIKKNLDK